MAVKSICEYDLCTGCFACANACMHKAITMRPDLHAELHPVINELVCVDCNLCRQVCPVINSRKRELPFQCLAVWEHNINHRKYSASGGIAAAMYYYVINCLHGTAYGVVWNMSLKAQFSRIEKSEGLESLKGSKYVQASVEDNYRKVRLDLQSDKWVLFIGTPCQIAGLLNFLHRDYAKLVTVDLLCHGVPPQGLLDEEIKAVEPSTKKRNKISNIRFRGNDAFDYFLSLWNGKELLFSCRGAESYYFLGFLTSITLRESCYSCPYCDKRRVGDLSIGDFIGVGKLRGCEFNPSNVSVVTLNTVTGGEFFHKVTDEFHSLRVEERNFDEAIKGGGSFRNASKRNPKRDLFLKRYERWGYRKAIILSLWKSILKYKIQTFIGKIRIHIH